MIHRQDLQIRDPYVYVQGDTYYLYGTTDKDCWKRPGIGFNVFFSKDLIRFSDPVRVFSPPKGFWGEKNFWAPEMHHWRGKYYLFASFKADGISRGTSALRADSPLGPFLPFGERRLTPIDKECLDGTLHVDQTEQPWLVYCHEWVQPGGGSICALRLNEDLSGAIGEPQLLFEAKDRPWAKRMKHSSGIEGYVTDGPFLHRGKSGRLYLLWSSFSRSGYALAVAQSESGKVQGPWIHDDKPLIEGGCGHGMVFTDLEGSLRLALHHPNETPNERPVFLKLNETPDGIVLAQREGLE